MGPTLLGLILDSSVAIKAERERLDVTRFLKRISELLGEREIALCSISVAEWFSPRSYRKASAFPLKPTNAL
jgi:hypothetical protein